MDSGEYMFCSIHCIAASVSKMMIKWSVVLSWCLVGDSPNSPTSVSEVIQQPSVSMVHVDYLMRVVVYTNSTLNRRWRLGLSAN